jgi:hypothetical protein
MFCHPGKYMFKPWGLTLVDSVAVYAYVTQAGCVTTEQLIEVLREFKVHRPCTCSRANNTDAGSAAHANQCSSRRAGVWCEALTDIGVPKYHAMAVIKGLRPHL